jgi:hypothetical protein
MTYVPTSYRTTETYSTADRIYSINRLVRICILSLPPAAKCSVYSYTVEILPFALRAKGFMLFGFTITLSLIFNQ